MSDESGGPSFEGDIRPLFRDRDRQQMQFAFDLWSYDDVKGNAQAILERLEEGDMPCDGPWSDEQVALFRRWAEEGQAP
jgi:hypothetical protein